MIFFGTSVGYPEKLKAFAAPGLTSSMREPYRHIATPSNRQSIFPVYAGMMREAADNEAECLVLMHDDLEFRDRDLAVKLRAALSDPSVAVVGLIGASGVRNLRWWLGARKGQVTDNAFGLHWHPYTDPTVDTLDGMMLALSPWALRNLTLDGLGYVGYHGYDADLCFQARARGKRVVVAGITAHHHSRGGFTKGLAEAEKVFQRRWIKA